MRTEQGHNFRLMLGLGGIVAAAAWLSTSVAAPALEYQMILDMPRGEERSSLPVAVSILPSEDGAEGEVCVTDAVTGSGFVFDQNNIRIFQTGLAAGLIAPMDVTVLSSGGFACTNGLTGGGRTIRRLNLFGERESFDPQPPRDGWAPEHLLVTRDGNYVTTDPALGLLCKHDAATGALLWEHSLQAGASGDILGLGRPAEAPDGRLYLPLGGEKHVAVVSSGGDAMESFGVPGTGAGRLSFPVGVAFCPDGNIAVLDRMRAVVLFYDSAHAFRSESGRFGGGPRDFYHPTAIAAAPDGRIYVAQGYLGRVFAFQYVLTGASRSTTTNHSRLPEAGIVRASAAHREGEGCL